MPGSANDKFGPGVECVVVTILSSKHEIPRRHAMTVEFICTPQELGSCSRKVATFDITWEQSLEAVVDH
jgi:hypothetical protein